MTHPIQERSWDTFYHTLFRVASFKSRMVAGDHFYQTPLFSNQEFRRINRNVLTLTTPQIATGANELKKNPSFLLSFSEEERLSILEVLSHLFRKQPSDEAQKIAIFWCKRCKESLGDLPFYQLSRPSALFGIKPPETLIGWAKGFFYTTLEVVGTHDQWIGAMQTAIELSDKTEVPSSLLQKYFEKKIALEALSKKLSSLKERFNRKAFLEKEELKVMQGFSEVAFPLPEEKRLLIFEQYRAIERLGKTIENSSRKEWTDAVKAIGMRYKAGGNLPEDLFLLLAIAREAMRAHFGIYPYNTQLLTVLGLLSHSPAFKGSVAQVYTGEGKSVLVTLLAFVHACQGKTVDVVSSSHYLARRDAEKYAPFFKQFDMTTSAICAEELLDQDVLGQILYGTHDDFEFAFMRDQVQAKQKRVIRRGDERLCRPFEVVIVDEVDNLLIDTAFNSARIGIPAIQSTQWIYHPILAFVQKHKSVIEKAHFSILEERIVSDLREVLMGVQTKLSQNGVAPFTNEQLIKWIKNGYLALYELKENRDYIVQDLELNETNSIPFKKKITIVDWKNTGRLQEKSRWQGGIHEFLEAKHQLEMEDEGMTVASLCHPVYLNQYQKLFGLTGTFGEKVERDEVETIYSVTSFDAPSHRKNVRQLLSPRFAHSKDERQRLIFQEVQEIQSEGRPILILCETLQEASDLCKDLQKEWDVVNLLDGLQVESESFLIRRAGYPGTVTVATNTAGRGTDILLSSVSKKNGGLHVILTFFPENDRIESQAFGRCARQGQPGSCRFILQTDNSLSQLVSEREEKVKKISLDRLKKIEMSRLHHRYLALFWKELQHLYRSPPEHFNEEKVRQLLDTVKKENKVPRTDLNVVETLVETAADAKELSGRVQAHLGHLAQQYWAHFFYDPLSDLEDEKDIEALYQTFSPIWKGIFEIKNRNQCP